MELLGAGARDIAGAARALAAGRLVAFPTETVYGLGADATDGAAVARIFEAKGRPRFNPLIVHVPDIESAAEHALPDSRARRLAEAHWPGPLTIVMARRQDCRLSELVSAGLPTVALRAPAHSVARRLLEACALPLAAPSANPSGRLSPTRAEHVAEAFAETDLLVIDGGPCEVGVESTIVDLSDPDAAVLLREGAITREELSCRIGAVATARDGAVRAPGMLASHYAPDKPVRLDADRPRADELFLAFGPAWPESDEGLCNLSTAGDLREAAANLFAMLHRLDRMPGAAIAVAPVPETGLGAAINDRLRRAAAER